MLSYLTGIPKNKAFRLYLSLQTQLIDNNGKQYISDTMTNDGKTKNAGNSYGDFTYPNWSISKDGASPVSLTNTPTQISLGKNYGYIDITAAEMNYDVIIIHGYNTFSYSNTSVGYETNVIIYTTVQELSAAPTTASTIQEKITALWQYFFLKRTMTATTETLYKDDGSTPLATSTITDDGTTVTHGEIA